MSGFGRRALTRAAIASVSALLMAVAVLSPAGATNISGWHWAHDGLTNSQIYFVDHTGVSWPVSTVTYKWNEAIGVNSYYETSCPSSTLHCVDVREYTDATAPSGCAGAYGCTLLSYGTNYHFSLASVYLNDTTVTNSTQYRKTTCQEEGHVLGLDHQLVNTSCMMQGDAILLGISPYPNAHDFSELTTVYNHTN